MSPLSVVVVDDDKDFRERYRHYFSQESRFDLVGEADDGTTGLAQWQTYRPDVVVMDLNMPVMGGHEACQRICCSDSGACVVILTVSDRAEDVGHALEVGASGYLVKADPLQVVAQAIEDATAGLMPLSAPVRSRLVEMWLHRGASLSGASQITLTSREYDIYECLARGLSNREIAQALFLAEGTIKQYVSRLAAKLGVCSRTQILRRMAEFEND